MKNLNIILLSILTILLMISCDKDDVIDEVVVAVDGNGVVTGIVTRRALGVDTITESPSRNTLVFLGKELVTIDSLALEPEEVYVGDGWYATLTNSEGEYFFEDLPEFEDWKLHVIPMNIDSIVGVDVTPDGDEGEQLVDAPIHISLADGEVDDGNNFLLSYILQTATEISGIITLDVDGDAVGDKVQADVAVYLYKTDETGYPGNANAELVATTFSDADGRYSFKSFEAGNYAVLFADQDNYTVISSGDITPDADPLATNPRYIPAFVETNEIDDGNNFLIEQVPSIIIGNVVKDTIGGVGVANQRVELYKRTESGVPTTPLVSVYTTDDTGVFSFGGLEIGNYVLYFIGNGEFACISGTDTTPELGEPDLVQNFFIAVDINSTEETDSGNIFIVE